MTAYYNENDLGAAFWLENLIHDGLIPHGHVDRRSIKDVQPDDLQGFTQCHFFAGIGGWAYAARLAGWPDDKPLWTGSCPCQPFSAAGRGLGTADDRHLWPDFHRLIAACRPPVVVGEQVARAAGLDWLDGVCADLEASDYATRAVSLTACAVNAPHERERLYWVAMADASGGRRDGREGEPQREPERGTPAQRAAENFWAEHEWVGCHDGKARRAKRGVPMLVDGLPGGGVALGRSLYNRPEGGKVYHRITAWKGIGNAIVPQLGAEVLVALMETEI